MKVGDETGSRPIVGGGGEPGNLSVKEEVSVRREGVDLGDVGEGCDGVNVVEEGGQSMADRLTADVCNTRDVFGDGGFP